MLTAAVLGSTGYTGLLLIRLLAGHPEVEEILAVSASRAGAALPQVDPGLGRAVLAKMPRSGGRLLSIREAAGLNPEVVFAALPHLESSRLCTPFFGRAVIIDLSADFRIKDPLLFQHAYGAPPPRQDLLSQAVYGLCEWYRKEIQNSDLIANPGCYPTAVLLALLPLLAAGLIQGQVVVNAISGISGAGRKAKPEYLFCARAENISAYAPGRTHRHTWEMEAELKRIREDVSLLFTPHLAPVKRGIAATVVAVLKGSCTPEDIGRVYRRSYGESPFINLRSASLPQTAEVWGTNRCDIGWQLVEGRLLLFSVIDNLMKGASGQAVQNMNIRFGLEETAGLSLFAEP